MTEVGIDTIVPWAAERCVARWGPDREDKVLHRLRTSAREAAKQSRRARFPEISGQVSTAAAVARVRGADLAILLDAEAGQPLSGLSLPSAGEIVLIVGPEGGVSAAEAADLTAAGAIPVRLGPSVLKGSTRAVARHSCSAAAAGGCPFWPDSAAAGEATRWPKDSGSGPVSGSRYSAGMVLAPAIG